MEGRCARYDAISDGSLIRVRIALDEEQIELPEFTDQARDCYLCLSPEGRWIHAPSGQLRLGGGVGEEHLIEVPAGDYRLIWFVRSDVCPFVDPEPIPESLAGDESLSEQLLVLQPMSQEEPRPVEELAAEEVVYDDWYGIQLEEDPQVLARQLDEPDEMGYRRLVLLYRLAQLDHPDARAVLEKVAEQKTQMILAIVARQVLSGGHQVGGPASLDGLPVPGHP